MAVGFNFLEAKRMKVKILDRAKAEAIVAPFIQEEYAELRNSLTEEGKKAYGWLPKHKFVSADNARTLLGEERYDRMRQDPIRWQGPATGSHYPWNVIDYVQNPIMRMAATPIEIDGDDALLVAADWLEEHGQAADAERYRRLAESRPFATFV